MGRHNKWARTRPSRAVLVKSPVRLHTRAGRSELTTNGPGVT